MDDIVELSAASLADPGESPAGIGVRGLTLVPTERFFRYRAVTGLVRAFGGARWRSTMRIAAAVVELSINYCTLSDVCNRGGYY